MTYNRRHVFKGHRLVDFTFLHIFETIVAIKVTNRSAPPGPLRSPPAQPFPPPRTPFSVMLPFVVCLSLAVAVERGVLQSADGHRGCIRLSNCYR